MGSSRLHKVMHKIGGKPMIEHTVNTLKKLKFDSITIVVGFKKEQIMTHLGDSFIYALQEKQLGTGHAIKIGLENLPKEITTLLVINGDDSAFYTSGTIQKIIEKHIKSDKKMSFLTVNLKGVEVSGRIVRENGKVTSIKSNDQFTPEELAQNNELACGLYLFDRAWLEERIPKIEFNIQGEYYITDLVDLAVQECQLQDIILENPDEWRSVNTLRELRRADRLMRIL